MSRERVCSALDGNAAAGLLREVFAFEATAARTTCAGCARMAPMAELRLYAVELGAILRGEMLSLKTRLAAPIGPPMADAPPENEELP